MKPEHRFPVTEEAWLATERPDIPILFFSPERLRKSAARFRNGFPGLTTYAVKANPDRAVLEVLAETGIRAFDVASPAEMALVRAVCPEARLHYHNPVRSVAEIAEARRFGIASWSVDRMGELEKLGAIGGQEIAVRLKLPITGAAYDFGSKFGAEPGLAVALLQQVAARGGVPSLTFHPGTQCDDPLAWCRYIAAAANIAREAGVRLNRLNVGGGFAAHRSRAAPCLETVFDAIKTATRHAFAAQEPALVCEPGRAMVAEAAVLALRVKAMDGEAVFLNDGIYGGLAEWRDMPASDRVRFVAPDGARRGGALRPRILFGPTCDSLDRLPEPMALPETLCEGDYLLFDGMGAYCGAIACGFNGYGQARRVVLGTGATGQGNPDG